VRLTPEQDDLRAAVRGLLDRHAQGEDLPSGEPDLHAQTALWKQLSSQIGVAGLAIPVQYGGDGAGPVEVHVVMEELGRSLTPSPMLGSAVLATQALLAIGDETACARLLPGLADGTEVAALAWTTPAGRWDPAEVGCTAQRATVSDTRTLTGEADTWTLSGEAHYVLDGDSASVLLVPAEVARGAIRLFEVRPEQPGVTRTACPTMDQARRLAVVRLTGAAGLPIDAADAVTVLDRARAAGCIALSAEQVGAAAAALAQTVAYTKIRVQFGRPIGSFQALAHRMAEMHVLVESARSLSYAAAQAAAANAPDSGLLAAAAKTYCSDALLQVSAEMIQLHGAIGMTWEHTAHRYFKRAHSSAMLLGTPAAYVDAIATAVIDSAVIDTAP
jgi:alkylation response protein AidB-like acyl-CoA dehydrogenase